MIVFIQIILFFHFGIALLYNYLNYTLLSFELHHCIELSNTLLIFELHHCIYLNYTPLNLGLYHCIDLN